MRWVSPSNFSVKLEILLCKKRFGGLFDLPPIGFCMLFLLGSKYVRLLGFLRDQYAHDCSRQARYGCEHFAVPRVQERQIRNFDGT